MMKYVLKAATAFATFMQTIFGKYKGGASGIAMEGLGDAASYADDLGSAADGAASGLSDAADSAKQLKKDLSVLPFDELNQLNKDREETSSGGGSGGSGGAGAGGAIDGLLDWGDLLENSEAGKLPDAISAWAQRIKNAFEHQQWNTLGQIVAQGINDGLRKVYDLLDPEKIKTKVDPWINAFTTSFNSLVRWLDFDLIGRIIGRGINNIVYIMDETINGIDWEGLGKQFASGVNGLVDETDFNKVGHLLGSKFMVVWEIMNGFVHDFKWSRLGVQFANGMNGFFDRVSFSTIADTLTTGLNGAFETLSAFAKTFEWDDLVNNITSGINRFIHDFKWHKNGQALGTFIENLCDALIDIIDETDWEGFGQGLALALQQIPWGKILKVVGKVIVDVLGGILRGLGSTPAGMLAEGIGFALGVYKFSKSDVGKFVGNLCKALTGNTPKGLVKNALSNLLSGGLSSLSIGAQFGAITAAIGGAVAVIYELTRAVDSLQGGNGIITEAGEALERYIEEIGRASIISGEQVDVLWQEIEEMESQGLSTSEMIAIVKEKLDEMGVSAETQNGIIQRLMSEFSTGNGVLEEYAQNLSESANITGGYSENVDDAFETIIQALYDARDASNDYSGRYDEVVKQLTNSRGEFTTTQDVINATSNILESVGLDAKEFASVFGGMSQQVQEDAQEMEEWLKTNAQGISESIANHLGQISTNVSDAVQEAKTAFENNARDLDEWQQAVTQFHDTVTQKLQNVGQEWGNIDTNQGDALGQLTANLETANTNMETAITNMETLNSSGLDEATVQAILKQIDPSSQAMTDLIEHMELDDATWATFHENLEKNMSLTENVQSVVDEMAEEYAKEIAPACVDIGEDFKVEFGKIGGFMLEGLEDGIYENTDDAADKMRELARSLQTAYKEEDQIGSPSKVYEGYGKDDVTGLANGVKFNQGVVLDEMTSLARKMHEKIKDLPEIFKTIGSEIVNSFGTEIQRLGSVAESAIWDVNQVLLAQSNELWKTGQSMGQSLANGFASVHIPVPYLGMYFSYMDFGAFSMSIPTFYVNWYRKGGLFTGGDGSLIGIGEDNRDEAVLPLEDRRAMARIGSAIADAGGANSMNDQIVDRLAERMVDIIMMSKSNEQAPIFNIEVKTENDEVLARAVERGQQRLDYRNNPTPKMAY